MASFQHHFESETDSTHHPHPDKCHDSPDLGAYKIIHCSEKRDFITKGKTKHTLAAP